METQNPQRYPISSQPFVEIREENYVYIDKTALVYEMTHSNSRYFF
ncbi:MAG: AAA family ATPase, partial [Bacteroidales bacterium]|nr:AAA family ATPase [Bacteroidales bacterium]